MKLNKKFAIAFLIFSKIAIAQPIENKTTVAVTNYPDKRLGIKLTLNSNDSLNLFNVLNLPSTTINDVELKEFFDALTEFNLTCSKPQSGPTACSIEIVANDNNNSNYFVSCSEQSGKVYVSHWSYNKNASRKFYDSLLITEQAANVSGTKKIFRSRDKMLSIAAVNGQFTHSLPEGYYLLTTLEVPGVKCH